MIRRKMVYRKMTLRAMVRRLINLPLAGIPDGWLIGGLVLLLQGCANNAGSPRDPTDSGKTSTPIPADSSRINYSVIALFPHDTTSFTEGLLVHDGQLFESTGSHVSQTNRPLYR